jgi:hypothetical protein
VGIFNLQGIGGDLRGRGFGVRSRASRFRFLVLALALMAVGIVLARMVRALLTPSMPSSRYQLELNLNLS